MRVVCVCCALCVCMRVSVHVNVCARVPCARLRMYTHLCVHILYVPARLGVCVQFSVVCVVDNSGNRASHLHAVSCMLTKFRSLVP